jgi:SHS2 domain-containing protein
MRPFYPVEHTGDLAIVAQGRDLRELCENAANGMLATMAEVAALTPTLRRRIEVSAPTDERLLMALLKELHFIHDAEGIIFTKAIVCACAEGKLTAEAEGLPIGEARARILEEIKAVTYHDLHIAREGDILRVKIVFDT